MAAGNAFLTQVSAHAWKCSECPLMFNAEDAYAVDRMLDRFMQHVRKAHIEDEATASPMRWKPRRRRRSEVQAPDPPATA